MYEKIFRIVILIIIDAFIVVFSSIMPLALRFGIFTMDIAYLEPAIKCLPADIVITIGVLAAFKLYNRVWTYAGIDEMISVLKASFCNRSFVCGIQAFDAGCYAEKFLYIQLGIFCLFFWQALEFQLGFSDSLEKSMKRLGI